MVPTAWLRLNALPRTPNGKLDRAQLPSLSSPVSAAAASIARTLRVPETALEGQLADIWKAVLNSEDIGIDDDLYALGADSIHLFQITARALREGIPLSAQLLVQYRTIAKIASALDAGTGTLSSSQRSNMPRLKKFNRMNGAATAGHGAGTV
jgi:aryl carrier-like protein